MRFSLIIKHSSPLFQTINALTRPTCTLCVQRSDTYPNGASSSTLQEFCSLVVSSVGGLDDLETNLNRVPVSPSSSSLVTDVIDSCKHQASARRLLRFFSWTQKNMSFDADDKVFNYLIQVLAEKKDHTAMQIMISDLRKQDRVLYPETFNLVAETLVKLGREDEALGIFKSLDKFKCPQDGVAVAVIVSALCSKGHVKKALGVVHHHRDKVSGNELCVYRSLLYGWSIHENVKESRKVIKQMKSAGITPDLFCYNTFLRCLCERNLKRNPSGLVPEALNVMMEMRSHRIEPSSVSYNMLLSCLGRVRRVKESCRVLDHMKNSNCEPDWVSYYLVVRVLYLTGRFGRGNKIMDEMIERGFRPGRKFYYDLIRLLCGVERVGLALELFEKMKGSSMGGYGPIYDVVIPKLCRAGEFEKGRELWDEAASLGVNLRCSRDVLDPSIAKAFVPKRKEETGVAGRKQELTITKRVAKKESKKKN